MATDYNQRAAVGQAINLAVQDAISNKRENDPKYIYKKFVYYKMLADRIQAADRDMLLEVINNKDFDKIISEIEGLLT